MCVQPDAFVRGLFRARGRPGGGNFIVGAHVRREYALVLAPAAGGIAASVAIAALTPKASAVPLIFPVFFTAYALVALVGVPLLFLTARFHIFSPWVVYLGAAMCAIPVAAWFFAVEPLSALGWGSLIAGLVTGLTFNAIFFRRIVP